MRKLVFTVAALFIYGSSVFATHIVGGQLYYDCVDPAGNFYQFTLILYRDCSKSSNANFLDPQKIGVYDGQSDTLIDPPSVITMSMQGGYPDTLVPETYQVCRFAPKNVCVAKAVYKSNPINFPPRKGGYHVAYQRCCRNHSIKNIQVLQPGYNTGASWVVDIPSDTVSDCNSSARFEAFPPTVICSNSEINFDHSATDPDGDSLSYHLCYPTSSENVASNSTNVADTLPDFDKVTFDPGYSYTNPLGVSDSLNIDSITGALTGSPPPPEDSPYVVAVCVSEYDDSTGDLISTNKRDFQYNVTFCDTTLKAKMNYDILDTCDNLVQFQNKSLQADSLLWNFELDRFSRDTSSGQDPYYNYNSVDTYTVRFITNHKTPCPDTVDTTIAFTSPRVLANFGYTEGCLGDSTVFIDSSLGNKIEQRHWVFDDESSAKQVINPTHYYQNTGNYNVQLSIETAGGCRDTTTKAVRIFPKPVIGATPKKSIVYGESTTIGKSATNGAPPYLYSWTPDRALSDTSIAQPTADPEETTSYIVSVRDTNNCTTRDTVLVEVLFPAEVKVPDAFTPDNDGLNDKFYAYDVTEFEGKGVETIDFKVFDRWGEVVFQTNNIHKGWDGRHMLTNQPMEVGVYVWMLKYTTETGKSVGPISGTVSLIR